MKEPGDTQDGNCPAWKEHVFRAAKAFLKCAVVIDDRPFFNLIQFPEDDFGKKPKSDVSADPSGRFESIISGGQKAVKYSGDGSKNGDGWESPKDGSRRNELDLKALTDSFAEQGIICGTLIPDDHRRKKPGNGCTGNALIERACKMAQTGDILIVDWFLRERESETTLRIVENVFKADKKEGGRTRLICIYTIEDGLQEICESVRDRLSKELDLQETGDESSIRLTNEDSAIVFINKGGNNGAHSICERKLPERLIKEFAGLIDGLLPTFAANSIGALRRNTHFILKVFHSGLDPAYVGNRAISDPSDEMEDLLREILVSEFDNQIGLSKSTETYLSGQALELWLQACSRIRGDFKIQVTPHEDPSCDALITIDEDLIRRAASGEIFSFDRPVVIHGKKYKINEKRRLKFTQALCCNDDAAKDIEEEFARLVSNKHEAYGGRNPEPEWRPTMTLGTLVVSHHEEGRQFYMCVTRPCDLVRLRGEVKQVVLLRIEDESKRFNLVVRDKNETVVRLFMPREFSEMRIEKFKIDIGTQRICGTFQKDPEGNFFCFESESDHPGFRYFAQLRYLRALRDVSEVIKDSTSICISDSEWLRLMEKITNA